MSTIVDVHVSKVSTRFDICTARFAILLGLILKSLELCAELNSASNGNIFNISHPTKTTACTTDTGFSILFPRRKKR